MEQKSQRIRLSPTQNQTQSESENGASTIKKRLFSLSFAIHVIPLLTWTSGHCPNYMDEMRVKRPYKSGQKCPMAGSPVNLAFHPR